MNENNLPCINASRQANKSSKYAVLSLILFIELFSNAALRSEDNLIFYMGISVLVILYAVIRGMCKPSRFSKTITKGISVWVVVLFAMYFFYGIVLKKYDFFNTRYFLFMFAMNFVTVLLLVDIPPRKMVQIFIKVCAFASVTVCIFILINEWSLIISGGTRIGESGSGNVNTIAIYLGMMSMPCLYKIMFEKKKTYLIPYTLSIAIMLLTGSKKALLLIILSILILTILNNRTKLHRYIPSILIIALVSCIIIYNEYLYNIIGFRVLEFFNSIGLNIGEGGDSQSSQLRLLMYALGYKAFLTNPLFGGGWFYFSSFSGLGTYAHNNYIELLVTYGLFGFLLYYSMFFVVLIKIGKIMKDDNYAKLLFTMVLLILINDFAAVTFSYNVLNYQILIIGYLYAIGTKSEQLMKNKSDRVLQIEDEKGNNNEGRL